MGPLSLIMGIADVIPSVVGWFGGGDAENKASKVVDLAKKITGHNDEQEAIAAIKANPELQVKMQQMTNDLIIAEMQEETKRLQTVNATMQAEYASDDQYVKRWRPTMGYVLTFTWALVFVAIAYVIVFETGKAQLVIQAVGQLTGMWSVALAVLGISVHSRSRDKQTRAGVKEPGILGAIAKRIGGGNG